MGNSIFELADKFGYDSPWKEDWTPNRSLSNNTPKITFIKLVKAASATFLPPHKKERQDNFFLIINVENFPDRVVVEYDNKIENAFYDSGLKKNNFDGNYSLYLKELLPVPFGKKEITFTVKTYDFYDKKKVTDIKTYSSIVTIDGGSNEIVIDKNNEINNSIYTIQFHTYSDGKIEKYIPKNYDTTLKVGKIQFFYHDSNSKEYFITDTPFHFIEKRKNGIKINIVPENYIKTYNYPKGGNAQTGYLYSNNDIVVSGTKYGIRKYPIDKGFIQLIKMPNSLKIKEPHFKIFYEFKNSQRRYCNPETFAAFIGALAKMSFEDVLCTGMCFEDATSYPSVTHPNGDSADTAYFSTIEKEQKKVDAFHFFQFKNIYRGKSNFYANLNNTKYSSGHEDHLHAGDFDMITVKTIIK